MPQPPHRRRASSWLLEAENVMVSTLFRPKPTTWIPAQDQPVQPAAAGGYITPSGEELFSVEWRDNDEVWFVVRAFDRPTAPSYRVFIGLVRRRRRALFQRYLRAISPLYTS